MKKHLSKILCLILIISLFLLTLSSCNYKPSNAKEIQFTNIEKDELNSMYLEKPNTNKMCFVNNSISDFSIYVNEGVKDSLKRAVNELQSVIFDMTNVKLEIKHLYDNNKGILIGNISNINIDSVENDGAVINIEENRIDIKGKDDDGTRNGIYTFLEEYLGVMFLSYKDTFIPKHNTIYLEKGLKTHNPLTAWRDVYSIEVVKNLWCQKLRLNGLNVEKTDEQLGIDKDSKEYNKIIERERQYNEWGTWCHSFYEFLSPDDYYETHPEYFSLYKGERIIEKDGRQGQLCLSNPEVYNIVERELLKKIEENPEVKYWDFSCNDSPNIPGCDCEECKKLDKAAGGTGMGSLLPFINKLARKVKEVYKDKEIYISTLAYLHTLKPPTNIEIEDNVVIKLCSMPGDQGTSYLNPGNKNASDFNVFLRDWSKIAKHIVVWDYVVDFKNLLMPFPNFAVQQENQLFYEQNNIQGIFHQASREIGGEMAELRAYVLSKLMWEGSSLDVSKVVSRFVGAYYGKASKDVIDYLNLLHKNLSDNGSTLGLYDGVGTHAKGYLSKENIEKYETIIESAKEKVKQDKKLTIRLEDIELNIKYAKINLPNIKNSDRVVIQNRVNTLAQEKGITMVREWQSLDEYNKNFDKELSEVKNEINKPSYIAVGILGGLVIVGLVIILVLRIVKNKKHKKV